MKRRIVAALGLLLVVAAVAAPPRMVRAQSGATLPPGVGSDDLAVRAREAFRLKDKALLFSLRQAAAGQGHPLAGWIEYWELGARLAEAQTGDFDAFAERWRDTYVEDRLRNDWLLELGRRRDWAALRTEFPRFRMNDDREVTCYALLAAHFEGQQDVRVAARNAWLAQRESDDGCQLLAATLVEQRIFGADDVWQALRVAFELNRPRLARERASLLDGALAGTIGALFKDPAKLLRDKRGARTELNHPLTVLALWRLAASDPELAFAHIEQFEATRLPAIELARAWAGIARQAAFKQHPRAADYARRAFAARDKASAGNARGRQAALSSGVADATPAPAAEAPAATTATSALVPVSVHVSLPASAPAAASAAISSSASAAPASSASSTSSTSSASSATAVSASASASASAASTSSPAPDPLPSPPPAPALAPAVVTRPPVPARRVTEPVFSDETLAWMARAALRAPGHDRTRWQLLLRAIDEMSAAEQRDPAWVYWRSRAIRAGAASGPEGEGARGLARLTLESIAGPLGFYAQLALEELGSRVQLPPAPVPLVESEREPVRRHAGLQRALHLMSLGLRAEGVREWNYSLRGMNDRELMAAAALACEREVWDRCINTSERTRDAADVTQRYPLPFREAVLARAAENGIDPAYVYGLIRQESRFIVDARSSAGASGLMQLMPRTARWTARRAGLADWRPELVNEHDVNLLLGTTYLKLVLEEFGGAQAMGAAAYNAGPSRPRRWREGVVLEPAAWIEGIPFNETRDYVKKVLSNAVVYAARLAATRGHGAPAAAAGGSSVGSTGPAFGPASLRARLGSMIGPRDPAAPAENRELP